MRTFCSKLALIFVVCLCCLSGYGQAPQGINYQAVLRDNQSGEVLRDQMVFLIISILEGGPNGTLVYEESHSGIATNDYGLINLVIGGGDATEGNFENIPWPSGNIWYEIEVDYGSGLQNLGAAQFLSVPFALHAGNVEESLDNDPTNELIDSASFNSENQSVTIQEGENEVNFTLDGLIVNDADADPTNELIVSAIYDSETNSILITQADGSEISISLAELVPENSDLDPTNELITDAEYDSESNSIIITQADGSSVIISLNELNVEDDDSDPDNERLEGVELQGQTLVITEAGQNYSANLDVLGDDADADVTNELIDDLALINDTILFLNEGGNNHFVNLSPLRQDDDWIINEEEGKVFNEDDKIGIGTNAPSARLEVVEESNSATALNVISGTESMLHVANQRLGVATTNPLSTTEFGGSVGYRVTLLDNEESDNYTAGTDDHMIVVNFQEGGNSEFGIFLPSADVCRGRVYIIRKTGEPGEIGDVTINTGSFPIDFDDPDLLLVSNNPETIVLLSLGNDGWTRL
jgi:hypothetical protein